MISDQKLRFQCIALGLFLSFIFVCDGYGRPAVPADDNEENAGQNDPVVMADQLAAKVREIANSNLISQAKKEKRISTAVRVAVVTATAYKDDAAGALAVAIDLTQAAARAAPHYAEVIANAAAFAPAVARIDSASARIRTAAFAAAKAPRTARRTHPAEPAIVPDSPPARPQPKAVVRHSRAPARPAVEDADEPDPLPSRSQPRAVARRSPAPLQRPDREEASPNNYQVADSTENDPSMEITRSNHNLRDDTNFNLTAQIGVRHDDNIFLTGLNKVADTVINFTPGVMLRFGADSLAHGSLNYDQAFTRYAGKTAPNVSLGAAKGDFGYDNGTLTLAATASFQQLNQNSNATASLGPQLFRRDTLAVALNGETELTTKTRIRTGVAMDQTEYKDPGLVGTRQTEIPLKIYLNTTAKTSVSAGATYRVVNPLVTQSSTTSSAAYPRGHDIYYNIGARGSFTPKLTGEFSVGYKTREVGVNPKENLWGFDGSFNYEATTKSSLGLNLSRDFSTGVQGESLTSDRFAFRFTTDPTPQWSFGATLSYLNSTYGPSVFSLANIPVTIIRKDNYWEGSLMASYLFTRWLSASLEYTFHNNHSTQTAAEYSNNVFSFNLGLRY
jgi:hypothetical protein